MVRMSADFFSEDFRPFLRRFCGTVDLIVTSPPYVDARTPGAYGLDKPWTPQDDRDLGDAMFAALRPGGTAIVVVGSPVRTWRPKYPTERGLEPVRWIVDLADRVGFAVRDVLVFGRLGLPGAYTGRFRNDWEPVIWLERPGGAPTFDKGPLDEPAAWPKKAGESGTERRADGSRKTRLRSGDAIERGIKRRGTVWDYGNVGRSHGGTPELEAADHPAVFPLRFAADAVSCFSRPGDLVVDPFCGRGTVAVACKHLGRRHAGGDLGCAPNGEPWSEVARRIYRSIGELNVISCGPEVDSMMCSTWHASWCPQCGECNCEDVRPCRLHGRGSNHGVF